MSSRLDLPKCILYITFCIETTYCTQVHTSTQPIWSNMNLAVTNTQKWRTLCILQVRLSKRAKTWRRRIKKVSKGKFFLDTFLLYLNLHLNFNNFNLQWCLKCNGQQLKFKSLDGQEDMDGWIRWMDKLSQTSHSHFLVILCHFSNLLNIFVPT